ncbi:MAG: protein kinase [Pseudomonadota bacterium]|nr:MAG: protein kinase [Pseudomonadota bacterium]
MDTENRPPSARYQTAMPIGHGAMGRVYRAWDVEQERFVALKYLRSNDPDWVRRLRAEAAAQARVEHPNVARIFGVGEEEGRAYIAMAYIDGRPFDELIGDLGLEAGVRILADCADAVQAAHAIGLVHRDLKPANILVSQTEAGGYHPYVVDFGLVLALDEETLTAPGEMLGTLGYMAPEQALGRRADVDRRADIYSLGCILYHLLAGVPPLAGTDRSDMLARLLNDDVPPPRNRDRQVPKALERICMQCLERAPERRYASAAALGHDLERWLAGESVKARATGLVWQLGRTVRRNPVVSALAGVALLIALTMAGWAGYEQRRLELRAAQAQRTGEALKDMEWRLRAAFMTPQADITWHKQALRERIDVLLAQFSDGDDEIGRAQRDYVLGRSWLMLDRPELAQTYLVQEPVWQRMPGSRFWAGYSLALVYRDALHGLGSIRDDDERAQKQRALDVELRQPALSLLAGTETNPDHAVFRDALVAWLSGQPERAVELARQSRVHQPWFYEAVLLEADILLGEHLAALSSAAYDQAAEQMRQVMATIERAVEIAPSAPQVLARGCVAARQAQISMRQLGTRASDAIDPDMSLCHRMVALDPEVAGHHLMLAGALSAQWQALAGNQTPPGELADQAVAAARRGLALDPENWRVVAQSAQVMCDLGYAMRRDARVAVGMIGEALELYRRAMALRPADATVWRQAGTCSRQQAATLKMAGQDPAVALSQAVDTLRRAVEMDPDHAYSRHNLAYAIKSQASQPGLAAGQAEQWLIEALAQAQAALRLSPDHPVIVNTLGNIHSDLGRQLLDQGLTDQAADRFEQAIAAYEQVSQINPAYHKPHNNRANVARIMAEHLAARSRDPSHWIAQGRLAVEAALQIHADYSLAWFNRGALDLIEARYLEAVGQSPTVSAQQAMDAFSRGLGANASVFDAWLEYSQAAGMVAAGSATDQAARSAAMVAMRRALEHMMALAPDHDSIPLLRRELAAQASRGLAAPQ